MLIDEQSPTYFICRASSKTVNVRDYIFAPDASAAHALHFEHWHPKIETIAQIPTKRYTTASSFGIEPKIMLTRFQFEPISIPAPTKPQFKPPITKRTFAILDITHPQLFI